MPFRVGPCRAMSGTVPDRAVSAWAGSPCRPDTSTSLLASCTSQASQARKRSQASEALSEEQARQESKARNLRKPSQLRKLMKLHERTGNLHNGLWGPLKLKRGYIQVFGYDQAFGCPTAATHRCWSMPGCLDPQTGLRTGVWIPNRGHTRVFGVQAAAATHGCLESQPRLHTGVCSPKRAIVQVAISNRRSLCTLRARLGHNSVRF